VFQLHDVLEFESAVVINVLINTSSPKLNNQFFSSSQHLRLNYFAVVNAENL